MFSDGTINDFNFDWYNFNGDVIVGAMMFNSILPPILEIMLYGVRVIMRKLDK